MKKIVALVLVLAMMLTAVSAFAADYSSYTIRIYSNSNSLERVAWLQNAAKEAGFSISFDDFLNGDTAVIQAANENIQLAQNGIPSY